MGYKLEKPYTDEQRADFVVAYQGMTPVETNNAFYFLETCETLQNDEIVDISNTEEYKAKVLAEEINQKKVDLKNQIDVIDKRRIRAICEPSIKDETNNQTWLEYYNSQILELRNKIIDL